MNRHLIPITASMLLAIPLPAQAPATPERPVELAICLDVSGSMDGLLDAARRNLWAIVNDLALATPTPRLRVALLTFGHQAHDPARGWVAVETGFTTDLDLVSQKLFALATNGGDEYVARVLHTALEELDWSPGNDGLRMIVVAGNEEATQDPEFKNADVCKAAIARGILVNSIYCGAPTDPIAVAWNDVAKFADGAFATIDQAQAGSDVTTPFDAEIVALGAELNATYVPYGTAWTAAQANQTAQDANANGAGVVVAAQRAVCKASSNYRNGGWDLVDALRDKSIAIADVKRAELPEALRGLSDEELTAHVAAMNAKRTDLQKRIAAKNVEREAFVATELQRRANEGTASFEFAVRTAIRGQAEAKGFAFRGPSGAPVATATPAADGTQVPLEQLRK